MTGVDEAVRYAAIRAGAHRSGMSENSCGQSFDELMAVVSQARRDFDADRPTPHPDQPTLPAT